MATKLIRITMKHGAWTTEIDDLVKEIRNSPIVVDVEVMD